MEEIVKKVDDWFAQKDSHFEAFVNVRSQLEEWFKGELILLFSELNKKGVISSFKRESKIAPQTEIDFVLQLKDRTILIELKAGYLTPDTIAPLKNWIAVREKGSVAKDFRRLQSIRLHEKYVLVFLFPNPKTKPIYSTGWDESLALQKKNFPNWTCTTKPADYPPSHFIAIWQLNDH